MGEFGLDNDLSFNILNFIGLVQPPFLINLDCDFLFILPVIGHPNGTIGSLA